MRWSVTLGEPFWLVLLAILPVLWWIGLRSLSGLGRTRKWGALFVRSAVVVLITLALADLQIVQISDKVCVNFVLDQSESISTKQFEDALGVVAQAAEQRKPANDLAGIVVAGRVAKLEFAPWASWPPGSLRTIQSNVNRQSTDLAAGIRMALACLPPDAAGRIVLLSDGNQNRGNVLAEALAAQRRQIPIDVVAIDYHRPTEVMVDKIVLPTELRVGDTVRLKVVVRSVKRIAGLLRVERITPEGRDTIVEEHRELDAGLNVLTVTTPFVDPSTYKFEAEFVPDRASDDYFAQNNKASAFTIVEGVGKVLLIEPRPGEMETLARSLREAKFAVVRMTPEGLTNDPAFLRPFDAIIVGDVPASQLDEEKQRLIAASTRDLGSGLIIVGGPQSYGPGGYQQSPLEEAMPVDCEIKSTVLNPKVAIVLVIDRSGSMSGEKLAMAIAGAKGSVDLIAKGSQVGVVAFDSASEWVRHLLPLENPAQVKNRIDSIREGGGTEMGPALTMAADALQKSDAMVKHIITLSDGMSTPADWQAIINRCRRDKITMTTVAISDQSDRKLMQKLAVGTGGRFHFTRNAKALPAIYARETKLVSRPLIYERPEPWSARIVYPTEAVQGLPTELPPMTGMVLTTPKSTADVPITSPIPAENEVNPVVASWQYGLGKSVAVTTDAGLRWTKTWPGTDLYGKFWSQIVRSAIRTSMPSANDDLHVTVQSGEGDASVVVDLIGERGQAQPLTITGTILRPDATRVPIEFRPKEPGRFTADFPTDTAGSYIVSVSGTSSDGKKSNVSTGVDVPYSKEYRDWSSNRDLLDNIASLTAGKVVDLADAGSLDFFRHDRPPAFSLREAWPLILLVSLVIFLADVAVRRIAVEWSDVAKRISWVMSLARRKPVIVAPAPAIDRLKTRKETIQRTLERSATFMATVDQVSSPVDLSALGETSKEKSPAQVKPTTPVAEPSGEIAESATSRLLKAKKRVWEERDEKKSS